MTIQQTVILIKESPRDSLIKDAGSVLAAMAMIFPGVWLDIATLEFVGGAVFLIWLLGRAISLMNRNTMTIEEARAELDRLAPRGATLKQGK